MEPEPMSFNLCATLNELEDYVEGTRVPEHSNVASLANASKHTRSDSCDFCSAILKLVRGDLQDRFERYTRTAILSLGHWDPSQTSGRFGLTLRMWPDHFAFLRDMGRNMLQTDGHETAGAPVFIEETVDGSQRFMGDESATSSRLFGLDLERRLAPTIVEVEKSSQTKEEWQWLANEYPSLISPLIRTVLGEISDGTACESFYNQLRSSRKRQRGVELDPGTRNDDSHPRLSKKRRTAAGIVSIASRTNSLQVDDEESAAYEALTEDHLLIIKKDEQHNLPEYPKDGYPGFGAAAVKQWNFDLVWANEIKSVIHSVPRSPTDQEVIRKIRRWLETCQTSHRCLKDKTRPILPTRVIDVGVDGGPGPRLVHTNGQKGRYATLSHCWGKGNPMKTTRANIYAMMAGIKFDDMSPLFQDAVRVCRVLDIPYLWIDSLCIIQGDKEDWNREGAKMYLSCPASKAQSAALADERSRAHNYRSGVLNLIALAAEDSQGRLLHDRPERDFFTIALPGGNVRMIRGLRAVKNATENAKLWSRGWFWQEFLLAPRALYFGADQLYWRCIDCRESESGVSEQSFGVTADDYSLCNPSMMIRNKGLVKGAVIIVPEEGDNLRDVYDLLERPSFGNPRLSPVQQDLGLCKWYTMVEKFSQRSLTVPSDTLPAFAAVVSEVAGEINDNYIAGLWEGDIIEGLLWGRDGPVTGFSKSVLTPSYQYRAPSWSWASVSGKIRHEDVHSTYRHGRAHKHQPQVAISAGITLADSAFPYGEVTDGSMVLIGSAGSFDMGRSNAMALFYPGQEDHLGCYPIPRAAREDSTHRYRSPYLFLAFDMESEYVKGGDVTVVPLKRMNQPAATFTAYMQRRFYDSETEKHHGSWKDVWDVPPDSGTVFTEETAVMLRKKEDLYSDDGYCHDKDGEILYERVGLAYSHSFAEACGATGEWSDENQMYKVV